MSDPDTNDQDTRSSGELEDDDQEAEGREEGEVGGSLDHENSSQDLSNSISPSSSPQPNTISILIAATWQISRSPIGFSGRK